MQLGYLLIYVNDVAETVAFYEQAFGLKRRFLHESGMYGEMETGSTALAFAADAMVEQNGLKVRWNRPGEEAAAFEVCLVTGDPQRAFDQAVASGATPVKNAETKPWGQTVAYVRDINGCLVELCTPVG